MKIIFIFLLLGFLLTACTPGIGIGIPVSKMGYIGVGANKNGLHTNAGVHYGPVGVGVSG